MYKYILAATLLLNINVQAQQKLDKNDLENLKNRLEGNFDSQEQSSQDSSYYNIALHIKSFELKCKHPDGYYLYVEQAMFSKPENPYRQRVYHLYRSKDTLISEVFELNEPERFVGAWNKTAMLKKLTKDSLIKREGCAVYFMKDDKGDYYGSTRGTGCSSSLKGATSATSEAVVYLTMLISWDRGWDANNHQVWGADKGGYRFRKFTNPTDND